MPANGSQQRKTGGSRARDKPPVHVGRRTVLGILGLTGIGIVLGTDLDKRFGGMLSDISSSIGVPLPGADEFRFYTVTGEFPVIPAEDYELTVDGMVRRPLKLNIADLRAMKRTHLVHRFQCVTGWYVPNVPWEGVRLREPHPAPGAAAQHPRRRQDAQCQRHR
jgi:hypothetical protein